MHEIEESWREEPTGISSYYLGLDLGQSADYTALIVNERHEWRRVRLRRKSWQAEPEEVGFRPLVKHSVQWLHRYQLGTSYPAIVESVRGILAQLP